jgi:2-amino-4-hydroxy-6-hydroxymethyldihydropteridine diphosphokinase
VQAFVALGANLGDPVDQVRAGAAALAALPATRRVTCSSLYRTAPIGYADQPDFINAVCEIDTDLPAAELMQALLEIERAHGRVRDMAGGPRTLDLDLLLYGDRAIREPALTVPHPRLHERAFVLYPLYEIAPDLEIPGLGRVADLLAGCAGQGIERLAARAG